MPPSFLKEDEMLFEIKSRFTGEVIFKLETESFKLCVEAAVKSEANLSEADLSGANLYVANLSGANLSEADLSRANLSRANLSEADLSRANLSGANLSRANLSGVNLSEADLSRADLSEVNLKETKGMVKTMGVEVGNIYWKRFKDGLKNNDFQFKVGLNKLRKGEVFADDERATCSYPAFHFASKSWCAVNYPDRPLEAMIRIPKGAKINEPWTTDGKASADKIEILKVYDVKTGKDVTRKFKIKE